MFKNLTKHIYSNILALAGYPFIWLLNIFYEVKKDSLAFTYVLIVYALPYIGIISVISLLAFIIEYRINKNKEFLILQKIANNIIYKIYLYTGFTIFVVFASVLMVIFLSSLLYGII